MESGNPEPAETGDPGGSSRRGLIWALGSLAAVVALVVVALVILRSADDPAGDRDSAISEAEATAPLVGGTPELSALRDQANSVLEGGSEAFQARLAELEGTPVVVNRWASWCGPCRYEFPVFQRVATNRGADVAFIGLNTEDATPAAESFLAQMPLPYPSFADPDGRLAESVDADYAPSTTFIDRNGEIAYSHFGPYESTDQLEADINRYAG